ncbi:MAG: sugar phosphate nucleotidyltransferase [Candidatus Kapabacteria bacterium]|nr:sugar phosphate nucleotidyltransferase [Candidatus Kapabacteria bacterium]
MNKAVIMAGGFGTRLRPLTMEVPKPMVPILNVPMMEHIVNLLKKSEILDVISLLYFQPEIIINHFGDGAKHGIKMNFVQAIADYGTAGSVKNAFHFLDSRFIIISGDVLTDFDLQKAIDFHIAKGAKATVLLTRVTSPLEYGIVMTDDDGKITRFLEKPNWGQVFSDTINTGIYILEPDVLDLIPYQEDFDFSKDLFPEMLSRKMPLYGFICEGYWRDVGNLDEYQIGQSDALHNVINLGKFENSNFSYGKNCVIPDNVKIKGNVLFGDNVSIGSNCVITNSVLGKDVKIGNGVCLSGVTIWDNVTIGDFAQLSDDVICNNVLVEANTTINENVYVGNNCKIGKKVRLSSNIKLWPNKTIQDGAVLSRSLVQEEKWMKELFTDARITGISNIEINPEFGAKLGSALGMAIGKNSKILASRDPHNVSRIIKRSITAGLLSVGVSISDLRSTSIPQTRQELMTGNYDGGFHIRRSVRNPNLTDIIIFSKDGRDISLSMTKKIERFFFGEDVVRVNHQDVGRIKYPERTNEIYVDRYLSTIDKDVIKSKNTKMFIDYSYGLASSTFPHILGSLNVDSLSYHDYVDSIKFQPDPAMDLPGDDNTSKIMTSLNYELGFRMEAGAEKIALIDERGVWLTPMRLLSVITKLFLETNKDSKPYKIAVSIIASSEIDDIAKDYPNVEVVRIKNSHSSMMEITSDANVKFIGGIYGGFIFPEFLFAADAMFTVGKILEMITKLNTKISYIDSTLPIKYQHKMSVNCPWDKKGAIMRKTMEHSEKMTRELIEGVKIFFENESVLLIPDKENSSFFIIADSDSAYNSNYLAEKYAGLIIKWLSEVNED